MNATECGDSFTVTVIVYEITENGDTLVLNQNIALLTSKHDELHVG